ncbi:MAG: transposase [Treponema sp.]|jgi:transposase|nr:transposase [Treponema sp.]
MITGNHIRANRNKARLYERAGNQRNDTFHKLSTEPVKNEVRDLSVRNWVCPVCRTCHDRDKNAALNILAEEQRILNVNKVCELSCEEKIPWDTGESTLGELSTA